MNKLKKLLCIMLVMVLAVSLFAIPAAAEETKEDDYPFVFVHGLMGWGERSSLTR